jgi:ketosteroid isomerase-like protein
VASEAHEVVTRWFDSRPQGWERLVGDPARAVEAFTPLLPLAHPELEFVGDSETTVLGSAAGGAGPTAVLAWYADITEVFKEWEEHVVAFEDVGDGRVLVVVDVVARSTRGDVPLRRRGAALYTVADGLVRRIEMFSDAARGYAAAGLPEPDGR